MQKREAEADQHISNLNNLLKLYGQVDDNDQSIEIKLIEDRLSFKESLITNKERKLKGVAKSAGFEKWSENASEFLQSHLPILTLLKLLEIESFTKDMEKQFQEEWADSQYEFLAYIQSMKEQVEAKDREIAELHKQKNPDKPDHDEETSKFLRLNIFPIPTLLTGGISECYRSTDDKIVVDKAKVDQAVKEGQRVLKELIEPFLKKKDQLLAKKSKLITHLKELSPLLDRLENNQESNKDQDIALQQFVNLITGKISRAEINGSELNKLKKRINKLSQLKQSKINAEIKLAKIKFVEQQKKYKLLNIRISNQIN